MGDAKKLQEQYKKDRKQERRIEMALFIPLNNETSSKSSVTILAPSSGHSHAVANRILSTLAKKHIFARCLNLEAAQHLLSDQKELLVVISPVRFGQHNFAAGQFVKTYLKKKFKNPLVLISVNMKAVNRKKRDSHNNPYLKEWINELGVRPDLAFAVRGKLPKRFGLFKRILPIPRRWFSFGTWSHVDSLTEEIAALCRKRSDNPAQEMTTKLTLKKGEKYGKRTEANAA